MSVYLKKITTAEIYTKILEDFLVPFIRDVYPLGHKFMQDNDPKYTSRHARGFLPRIVSIGGQPLLRVQMRIQ